MYVAILIQYAAFIVAAFFVYRVACSIFSGKLRPALVFVGYAFSISFIYDQEILTDSLFNNLFVITTCAMAIAAQRGRLFCGWALLALGFVALAIVLTRPIGLYLSVVFLPVFFLLARFVDAAPRWRVARSVPGGGDRADGADGDLRLGDDVLERRTLRWRADFREQRECRRPTTAS